MGYKLVLFTTRKLPMSFRFVPKSETVNDIITIDAHYLSSSYASCC